MPTLPNLCISGVLVMFLCAGCATSPVSQADSRPVDPRRLLADYALYDHPVPHGSRIVVTRDAARFDGPESAKVFVDGHPVAYLQPGERVELYAYAGDRILGVGSTPGLFGAPEVFHPFVLRPGGTYPFRVGIVRGRFDIRSATPSR